MTLIAPVPTKNLWDDVSTDTDPFAKVAIHSDSGSGKTTFATDLPWGPDSRWGEKGIYIAWDYGSEGMESVSPANRAHLDVKKPRRGPGYDPYETAYQLASHNWAALGYKTLIWDTMSEYATESLRALAQAGAFASRDPKRIASGTDDSHISVGTKGKPGYIALPIEGDYGLAQNLVDYVLTFLLNQPMNVIVLFQSDIYIPKSKDGQVIGEPIGGPSTAGGKAVNKVNAKFNTVVRLTAAGGGHIPDAAGRPIPAPLKYIAQTEPRGCWKSKLRKPKELVNTIAEVDVTGSPRDKFWKPFDALTMAAWGAAK